MNAGAAGLYSRAPRFVRPVVVPVDPRVPGQVAGAVPSSTP
jgi:hypothetical protein